MLPPVARMLPSQHLPPLLGSVPAMLCTLPVLNRPMVDRRTVQPIVPLLDST
jgi:hypothetical protein